MRTLAQKNLHQRALTLPPCTYIVHATSLATEQRQTRGTCPRTLMAQWNQKERDQRKNQEYRCKEQVLRRKKEVFMRIKQGTNRIGQISGG